MDNEHNNGPRTTDQEGMKPLTLDDLIPLEEYAGRRPEFFQTHRRYVDRYRRVRIGPSLTLLFENRQTLLFRVQEIVRIARLIDPERLQQELDLHNPLLPGSNQLQAAMVIDVSDETRLGAELDMWKNLQGEHIGFRIGDVRTPATLVTCRPEDRCAGTAHWVQFALDASARRQLTDAEAPAFFECVADFYRHCSGPLTDDVRQSLLQDLS